jgi:hypothetical protein
MKDRKKALLEEGSRMFVEKNTNEKKIPKTTKKKHESLPNDIKKAIKPNIWDKDDLKL